MKVFGVGNHKTGTMSLAEALNTLEVKTLHWPWQLYYDLDHSLLDYYDGFADFPVPLLYKKLDAKYPGSRFILTVRGEDTWLRSVEWHFTEGRTKFEFAKCAAVDDVHRSFYGTTRFNAEIFIEKYRRHNEDVTRYFEKRPEDLLVLNFERGDGFEALSAFLGKEMPREAFPHSNRSDVWQGADGEGLFALNTQIEEESEPCRGLPGRSKKGAAPQVSVVIIFLNEERFLRQAVDSVFAQTVGEWEILLVDDGSRDASSAIAKQLAEQRPDRE